VETLEKDDEFRKKLETADEADIRVCTYYVIKYKNMFVIDIYCNYMAIKCNNLLWKII